MYLRNDLIIDVLPAIRRILALTAAAVLKDPLHLCILCFICQCSGPAFVEQLHGIHDKLFFFKTDGCNARIKIRSLVVIVKAGYQKIIRNPETGFSGAGGEADGNIVVGADECVRDQVCFTEVIKDADAGFHFIIIMIDTFFFIWNTVAQQTVAVCL